MLAKQLPFVICLRLELSGEFAMELRSYPTYNIEYSDKNYREEKNLISLFI